MVVNKIKCYHQDMIILITWHNDDTSFTSYDSLLSVSLTFPNLGLQFTYLAVDFDNLIMIGLHFSLVTSCNNISLELDSTELISLFFLLQKI